jgi:hypothetical protein
MGASFTLKQVEDQTAQYSRIVELLRHADLGVTGARVMERKPPANELVDTVTTMLTPHLRERFRKQRWLLPELTHHGSGKVEVPLPWDSESAGTRRFFSLAGPWLDIVSSDYTACVDELETSMHPLIVRDQN